MLFVSPAPVTRTEAAARPDSRLYRSAAVWVREAAGLAAVIAWIAGCTWLVAQLPG